MKFYNHSDTCPIGVLWKIQETGDLNWLIIQPKENYLSGQLKEGNIVELQKAFDNIEKTIPESAYDVNQVDANYEYQLVLNDLLTETDENQKAILQNELNILKMDLGKPEKKVNHIETLAILQSELNVTIDMFECSISMYYEYSNLYQKKQKALENLNKKQKNGR